MLHAPCSPHRCTPPNIPHSPYPYPLYLYSPYPLLITIVVVVVVLLLLLLLLRSQAGSYLVARDNARKEAELVYGLCLTDDLAKYVTEVYGWAEGWLQHATCNTVPTVA